MPRDVPRRISGWQKQPGRPIEDYNNQGPSNKGFDAAHENNFSVNFDHSECVACCDFGEVRGGDSGRDVLVPGEGGKLGRARTTNERLKGPERPREDHRTAWDRSPTHKTSMCTIGTVSCHDWQVCSNDYL